jgi:hypothetical protein
MRRLLKLLMVFGTAIAILALEGQGDRPGDPAAEAVCRLIGHDPDLVDHGDGTVEVAGAGRFQRDAGRDERAWEQARRYCDELRLAGLTWRLPVRTELERITKSCPQPDGCRLQLPFTGPCGYYWAADPDEEREPGTSERGFTDMEFGGSGFDGPDLHHYVRCVAVPRAGGPEPR